MVVFPVDMKLLREKPELFREAFKKRFLDPSKVDVALELDRRWREKQKELEEYRHKLNLLSKLYGFIKSGREISEDFIQKAPEFMEIYKKGGEEGLKEEAHKLKIKIEQLEREVGDIRTKLIEILWNFPNFVAPDSPIGPDESYNRPIEFWGVPIVWKGHLELFKEQTEKHGFKIIDLKEVPEEYIIDQNKYEGYLEGATVNPNEILDFKKLNEKKIVVYRLVEEEPIHHYDLVKELKIVDTDKAGEVAGSRFYFEFGKLVLLDLAIGILGLKFLEKRSYKLVIPPYMLKKEILNGIITLDDFEDMMYKIEGEDLFLIGTAEHPITALYYNEIFEEHELPLKIAGWSVCFRKEAGAHGKDTKGIFRTHQFHKVEQYIFSKPEDSEKLHWEMINNEKEFLQMLGIPYRIVDIATGDMGKRNYKQFDLEGWFPGQGKYRELGSGSNVTDWQARRSNIRYRKKDGKLEFVHTLNCTLVAHQRTLISLLENNYIKDERKAIIPGELAKIVGFNEISI